MRSKLFVPGSRPELFTKALAGEADALSVDLEDSVVDSRKGEARDRVSAFLASQDVLSSGKLMIVRCNAVGSPEFDADVQSIALPALDILNLPKTQSAADIKRAAEALGRAEARNGVTEPIAILATVESPAGLRSAAEIAAADPRVVGLQLGLNDLFAALGVDRADTASVHATMLTMRIAAGEAGVSAFDGAYADFHNDQGFVDEATMARRLGYSGKSCVHPRQVALANDVFTPSGSELAEAERVLEAAQQACKDGVGACTLDGRMIDRPAILRAEALVTASKSHNSAQ